MIHWKHKPIQDLTKPELRTALVESIHLVFDRQSFSTGDAHMQSFLIGVLAGTGLSIIAVAIALIG